MIMAELGFRTIDEMVGRVDALDMKPATDHWKARGIDLSAILRKAEEPPEFLGSHAIHKQDHELDRALDNELIELAEPALKRGEKVYDELTIVNTNRVVGGMLSNRIIREVGAEMLPPESIHFKFHGSAGQSFGAWLARGVTLEVEGDANDYVGKGLSGGRVVIYPPKESVFRAEDNIIVGNVVLYGATAGECFFRGQAAERFCVRNSGAHAVVEGVGDHGCEYMTGGRVVILGPTGRNFGAGMSGGIAYIWDPHALFAPNCNMEMVELEELDTAEEIEEVRSLVRRHADYTGSTVAQHVLSNWERAVKEFVKVMPTDYKRVLEAQKAAVSAG
jgi:glutamate synthase domain-containing protein 3